MSNIVMAVVVILLLYAALDFFAGMYYGKCVVPGLKCRECRGGKQ